MIRIILLCYIMILFWYGKGLDIENIAIVSWVNSQGYITIDSKEGRENANIKTLMLDKAQFERDKATKK